MEAAPFWIFLLTFIVKFAHRFILESNRLLKSLIPFPQSPAVAGSEEQRICAVSGMMEKMGLKFDDDEEEEVKSSEVSRIFEEKEPSIEELRAAFDVFDENRDGFIDEGELKRVIGILGLGKGFDLGDCRKMIRVFDEDGDGRIDSDEFIGIMRRNLC